MSSKPNIRIGARFCERIGAELRQSATYTNRGNFAEAKRIYEDVQQMLDTFLTETRLGEYIERGTIKVPAAPVVAESKPAPKSTGRKAPSKKGSGAAKQTGGGVQRSDKGTERPDGGR